MLGSQKHTDGSAGSAGTISQILKKERNKNKGKGMLGESGEFYLYCTCFYVAVSFTGYSATGTES